MFTKLQIRDAVRVQVQDDAKFITPDEFDDMIDRAILQVNRDRPFEQVSDIVGDSTQDYALPSTFTKGFSTLEQVEWPADENPPNYLDLGDDILIPVYEDPTKGAGAQLRLRFLRGTPTSPDVIRVTYMAQHVLDDDDPLLSTTDQNAFMSIFYWCTAEYLEALAAKFNQTAAPSLSADAVDYGGRAQSYLFQAASFRTKYKNIVGLGNDIKAGQAFAEKDLRFINNEPFLWHPERRR